MTMRSTSKMTTTKNRQRMQTWEATEVYRLDSSELKTDSSEVYETMESEIKEVEPKPMFVDLHSYRCEDVDDNVYLRW